MSGYFHDQDAEWGTEKLYCSMRDWNVDAYWLQILRRKQGAFLRADFHSPRQWDEFLGVQQQAYGLHMTEWWTRTTKGNKPGFDADEQQILWGGWDSAFYHANSSPSHPIPLLGEGRSHSHRTFTFAFRLDIVHPFSRNMTGSPELTWEAAVMT